MEDEILNVINLPEQSEPDEEQVPAEMEPLTSEEPAEESQTPPQEIAPEASEEAEETAPAEAEEDALSKDEEAQISRRIRRKRIFRGALRFYTLLFGGILCVLILLLCLMNPLKTLLSQYEASQPQYAAAQIYDTLFADPDWALLYDMAGIKATEFEGRREYVTYMNAKVGNQELEYVEIPSGSSTEKRYSVRLEGAQLATFTMLRADDGVSTFGRWAFGQVEVFFTREESVTVTLMPGYTVYINGVPLDDSYTTLRVDTLAEDYLPEGVHGFRYEQQTITGLLVQPEVVVLDEYNNPVELTQDPATGIYSTPIAGTASMTWGEQDLAISTVQAQALFNIQAITVAQLREYVSPGSQAYEAITGAELVAKKWKSYEFDESATVVKDFYRYNDRLFSVWAQVTLNVKDKKGKVTSYTYGGTFFFSPNTLDTYMATDLLDVDLQQQRLEELSQPE